MEKKETYKAPEMRSVVLIKENVMNQTSPTPGAAGGDDKTLDMDDLS